MPNAREQQVLRVGQRVAEEGQRPLWQKAVGQAPDKRDGNRELGEIFGAEKLPLLDGGRLAHDCGGVWSGPKHR